MFKKNVSKSVLLLNKYREVFSFDWVFTKTYFSVCVLVAKLSKKNGFVISIATKIFLIILIDALVPLFYVKDVFAKLYNV